MSYTRADAAVDVCISQAAFDIDTMDPDQIESFARQCVSNGRFIRDGLDEYGYEKYEKDEKETCVSCDAPAVAGSVRCEIHTAIFGPDL